MIVDIRKDIPDFLAYIRRRVKAHRTAAKKLGKPKPIGRIDFGFEFGQGNELWLVFDTRPKPEPDGFWTSQVGKVPALKRPHWPIWHELPDGEIVEFIDRNGKTVNVMKNPDKKICKIVGEAMKSALLAAREAGEFRDLTTSPRCELGVENMEGYFGWPRYEDRGKENLV